MAPRYEARQRVVPADLAVLASNLEYPEHDGENHEPRNLLQQYNRSVYLKGYRDGLAARSTSEPTSSATTTLSQQCAPETFSDHGDPVLVGGYGLWPPTCAPPPNVSLPPAETPDPFALSAPVLPAVSDCSSSQWLDNFTLQPGQNDQEDFARIQAEYFSSKTQAFHESPATQGSATSGTALWLPLSQAIVENETEGDRAARNDSLWSALDEKSLETIGMGGIVEDDTHLFNQEQIPSPDAEIAHNGDGASQPAVVATMDDAVVHAENTSVAIQNTLQYPFQDLLKALPRASKASLRSRQPVSNSASSSKISKSGAQLVFRAKGRKRSQFDEDSRNGTALTREIGACGRCKEMRVRCGQRSKNPFVNCDRCAKLPFHLLKVPCCQVEIIDLKLYRLGSTATPHVLRMWTEGKMLDMGRLLLPDGSIVLEQPRQVRITQDIITSSFPVTLARFLPGPGDETTYRWTDTAGIAQEFEMPPYFIANMAEAEQNIRQFFRLARAEWPRALLKESNPIVRKTFGEAERYYDCSKSTLVAAALYLWSATRLIERTWLICGDDLLGFPPMTGKLGPCRYNSTLSAIPVTPIMDTQLDELAIEGVLKPLKANFLRLLKQKILERKRENWYEIYLASFLVLHDIEMVLDHALDFAHRFGILRISQSNCESSLSHAYLHTCKTILAYYHFAAGGAAPLALPALDDGILDDRQSAFVRDMQVQIASQGMTSQSLAQSSMYKTELYWCIQLFFGGWKADAPHVGDLLGLTEKDFMFS